VNKNKLNVHRPYLAVGDGMNYLYHVYGLSSHSRAPPKVCLSSHSRAPPKAFVLCGDKPGRSLGMMLTPNCGSNLCLASIVHFVLASQASS